MATLFPSEEEYSEQQHSYYAGQQSELKPSCRCLPKSVDEVSAVLKLLGQHQISFAVKAGGHSTIANASNIGTGGISIDLDELSNLQITESSVLVGAGWRWGPLYKALAEHGLTVAGGRVADVGVSGYLLGGGLNYFGNRDGWAANLVQSYEVVLWNGTVVNAAASEHADLFWALHGSNVAGIVTKYELKTLPDRSLLTYGFAYDTAKSYEVSAAVVKFASKARSALDISTMTNMILGVGGMVNPSYIVAFVMTNHTAAHPSFEEFERISGRTAWGHSIDILPLAQGGVEPVGRRQWKATLTFKAEIETLRSIDRLLKQADVNIRSRCRARCSLVDYRQPLGDSYLKADIFGLDPSDGPLMMYFLQAVWDHPKDDACIGGIMQKTFDDMENATRQQRTYHPFRYRNYAAGFQDVYESFGSASKERLRTVQRKYDPGDIYNRLVPGGHRLGSS